MFKYLLQMSGFEKSGYIPKIGGTTDECSALSAWAGALWLFGRMLCIVSMGWCTMAFRTNAPHGQQGSLSRTFLQGFRLVIEKSSGNRFDIGTANSSDPKVVLSRSLSI